VVTIRTTRFNIHNFYTLPALYVLCGCQKKKQRLFLCAIQAFGIYDAGTDLRFDYFTVVLLKIQILGDVTLCVIG
jgi:hypothetical protein